MATDEAVGELGQFRSFEERTAIWLQERPAGYDQLQWVHDRELLSLFFSCLGKRLMFLLEESIKRFNRYNDKWRA